MIFSGAFSFDKEKMEKECKKLIRISNLGEKTLKGYLKGKYIYSRDYSITELAFLKEVSVRLLPDEYWCQADINEKGRLLPFYKSQITGLFVGKDAPYEMTDYEDYYTDRLDCYEEFYHLRMGVKDFYDFATEEHNPVIPILKNICFVLLKDFEIEDSVLNIRYIPDFKSYLFNRVSSLSTNETMGMSYVYTSCLQEWIFRVIRESGHEDYLNQYGDIIEKIIESHAFLNYIHYMCSNGISIGEKLNIIAS